MKPFVTVLMSMILCAPLWAQKDTVDVPGIYGGGAEGNLYDSVQVRIDAGTLNSTVFRLALYDLYVLTEWIEVPEGDTLEIVAPPAGTTQETAPPQILWTTASGRDATYMFNVRGNLTLKNIWVRFADADVQVGSPIAFQEDALATAQWGIFENCIFDYMSIGNAGGAISVMCKHFNGVFRNLWLN